MPKLIRTLTFHRAHNHGSMLQAYALQRFISLTAAEHNIEASNAVIDFRPPGQDTLYSVLKPWSSLRNIIKNILTFRHYHDIAERHRRFEQFVSDHIPLTTTYDMNSIKDDPPQADIFLCGSDQIWNVRALDCSPTYWLDFDCGKAIKASYAASLGPLVIDWNKYDCQRYNLLINQFDRISVREEGSAYNLHVFDTDREISVHVDPTLLIGPELWRSLQSDAGNKEREPYILLYCLEPTKSQIETASAISRALSMPLIALRDNNRNDRFNRFRKRYWAGPSDFLSFVDNAALVLTSSFHGTAFSLIYHKPFYVFDGQNDARISSILEKCRLKSRIIDTTSYPHGNFDTISPDFSSADLFIGLERQRSSDYLLSLFKSCRQ